MNRVEFSHPPCQFHWSSNQPRGIIFPILDSRVRMLNTWFEPLSLPRRILELLRSPLPSGVQVPTYSLLFFYLTLYVSSLHSLDCMSLSPVSGLFSVRYSSMALHVWYIHAQQWPSIFSAHILISFPIFTIVMNDSDAIKFTLLCIYYILCVWTNISQTIRAEGPVLLSIWY